MFINDNFLLQTKEAEELYHSFSKDMPIIDYHCHLIPQEIAEDRRWENMAQIWLYGDHYKWRQMRTAGISEDYCTGNRSDYEKFAKFAELMPRALRNPLYHWSHLELKRYFNIDQLLSPQTADAIWKKTTEVIQSSDFSARSLMKKSNVKVVCTTDDPTDTLEYHKKIANNADFDIQVRPTWRPDKAMAIMDSEIFYPWLNKLANLADMDIANLADFICAIRKRHDFFAKNGCLLSDRGITTVIADDYTENEIKSIFDKVLAKKSITECENRKFTSYMLHELAVMDAEKGWTMQIHYGVLRNNNSMMYAKLGADTGFDSIGDWSVAEAMVKHLDRLNSIKKLPKTIIYPINPSDNELIATMVGNFQDGTIAGKIQFGSGWWFLDQLDGMTRQIESLSQLGLLSCFVGMLTDSRSFLSYTRHEYFRRLLCNILGNDMAKGLIPSDMKLVGKMVSDISYNNAAEYFGFFNK